MKRMVSLFLSFVFLFSLTPVSGFGGQAAAAAWSTNNIADYELASNQTAPGRWSYVELNSSTLAFAYMLSKGSGGRYATDFWVKDNNKPDDTWYLTSQGQVATDGVPIAFVYTVAEEQAGTDLRITGSFRRDGQSRLRILTTSDTNPSAISGAYTELYNDRTSANYDIDFVINNIKAGNDILFVVNECQWHWVRQTLDVTISAADLSDSVVISDLTPTVIDLATQNSSITEGGSPRPWDGAGHIGAYTSENDGLPFIGDVAPGDFLIFDTYVRQTGTYNISADYAAGMHDPPYGVSVYLDGGPNPIAVFTSSADTDDKWLSFTPFPGDAVWVNLTAGAHQIKYVFDEYHFNARSITFTPERWLKRVESVALDQRALGLTVGSSAVLTATLSPADAYIRDVTWESSAPAVASVSQSGAVTALAPGTATITVTAKDGLKTDSCLVTVTPKRLLITAKSEKTGNIFINDEPYDISLTFANRGDAELQGCRVTVSAGAVGGAALAGVTEVLPAVPAGGSVELPVDLSGITKYGVFRIDVEAVYDGGVTQTASFPFSRTLSTSSLDIAGSRMGVCTHFAQHWDDGLIETNLELMRKAGIKWIRDEMYWTENTPGAVEILPHWDEYVRVATEKGIGVVLCLSYGNALYDNGSFPSSAEGIAAYANYCATLAAHFTDIEYFEIWNEWSGGSLGSNGRPVDRSAEAYARMLLPAARAIKAVRPDAKIIAGATVGGDTPWIDRMLRVDGVYDIVDAVSMHTYCYPMSPETSSATKGKIANDLNRARENMIIMGREPLPIWITEQGWPTSVNPSGVPQERAAAYLARVNAFAEANPDLVGGITWYDFQDDGFIHNNDEHEFGIINSRSYDEKYEPVPWSAKAAYPAAGAYNTFIATAEFVRDYNIGRPIANGNLDAYAYEFRRPDGGWLAMLWSNDGNPVSREITLPVNYTAVIRYDMYGNGESLPVTDGKVTLTLTEQPTYLVSDGVYIPVYFPTNNISDYDLETNTVGAGRWSYVSLSSDLSSASLLRKGDGGTFKTDEWAESVTSGNHTRFVKANGDVSSDHVPVAFVYTVASDQEGKTLSLSGKFLHDGKARLRVIKTNDTDKSAIDLTSFVTLQNIQYDNTKATVDVDLVVDNVRAGNDILFIVNDTDYWWVSQNLNMDIKEYTAPAVFPTNNIREYNLDGNQVAPGRWSYLSLNSDLSVDVLLQKGQPPTFQADEWVKDNAKAEKAWYLKSDGTIGTDGRPIAFAYTVHPDQAGMDLRITGVFTRDLGSRLRIYVTNDANGGVIGASYNLIYDETSAASAALDIVVPNVQAGNDIVFAVNKTAGEWWVGQKLDVTISEKIPDALNPFPTNNIADYNLETNRIEPGRWSYITLSSSSLAYENIMQKGRAPYFAADEWVRDNNKPEHAWYVKANGAMGTDQIPVAFVYTIAGDQDGMDIRIEGSFRATGNTRLRIVKTNDVNPNAIGSPSTYTTLFEKTIDGNSPFSVTAENVKAGNDIIFMADKRMEWWWEASYLDVTIGRYIPRVEEIRSSADQCAVYAGDCAELSSATGSGVEIYYTTDNSNPQTSATAVAYAAPILIDRDMVIKAYGKFAGMEDSLVSTFTYVLNNPVRDFLGTNQGGNQSLGGMKWTREDFNWGSLFSGRGAVNQDKLDEFKQKVLDCQKSGINMLPVLCYTADWAANRTGYTYEHHGRTYEVGPLVGSRRNVKVTDADGTVISNGMESADLGRTPLADNMLDAWLEYVEFMVRTFSAPPYNIKYFQIWNEAYPTSGFWAGGMDNYMTTVHIPAARKIQELGCKVVYGGWICGAPVQEMINLLDKYDAWDTIDVHDLHYYPLSGMKLIHDEAEKRGASSAIWQTEIGFTTNHSFISQAYPKIFYWALENGMAADPDFAKLMYFAWWSPNDSTGWAYQHTLMNGGEPSNHGLSVRTFASLLNGAAVEPFKNFSTDPGLKPEIDENLSAAEGFLVDGGKAVIALHMTEQLGTGLFTDLNGDGRSIDLRDPNAAITVNIGGVSGTPAVKRVDILGNELALSAEFADGALRVRVPVADASAAAAAVNNASVTKTFYLVVESGSAIVNGTWETEPSSYRYVLPEDWASALGRSYNALSVANLYSRSQRLALTTGNEAYALQLGELAAKTSDNRARTALAAVRNMLNGQKLRPYDGFATKGATSGIALRPAGNENFSAAEGFAVDNEKVVVAFHMVRQNDADLFTDWNGTLDSIHMSHDNPYVVVTLEGIGGVTAVKRADILGNETALAKTTLADGSVEVKVPINDDVNSGAFMRTFYLIVEGTVKSAVDKTALDRLIAETEESLRNHAFDAYDVSGLLTALGAAKVVSADEDASQDGVDDAYGALEMALRDMRRAAFSCPVKSMLAKVAKLQAIPYSWNGAGSLTFATSNPAVCGVTQDGTLIPMKAGIAVITITVPGSPAYVFAVTVSN